ncbi:MAG: hypothetical protein HY302_10795 [Opitutae bacterium]|nr:hypothetical protein [Opitutae bacterium]
MRSALRSFLLFSTPVWLIAVLSAQTFIGNLNGSHSDSTFEGLGTTNLPVAGWVALSGSPRTFNSTNDALINGAGQGFAPFSVQYVTSTAPVANMKYTLSFVIGYVASGGTGNANFSFSLGTWDGSTFTALATASGGPVPFGNLEASVTNGVVESLTFTSGASVSSDPLAVRWAQTNTSSGADFLGIDNVTLAVSAVPEPGAYAVIGGVVAVFAAGLRRRILRRTA